MYVQCPLVGIECSPQRLATRLRDYANRKGPGWSSAPVRERFFVIQAKWLRRHRFALGTDLNYGHAPVGHWDRFGKTHPEYFAQRPDGKRREMKFFEQEETEMYRLTVLYGHSKDPTEQMQAILESLEGQATIADVSNFATGGVSMFFSADEVIFR